MNPYYEDDRAVIYNADLRDVPLDPTSVDAVVTDPPFFMPADHTQPADDGGNTAKEET